MLTKYGTYVIFKCERCSKTIEVPLHMRETPQLEKYAYQCTHEWKEVTDHAKTNREKSRNL
jgi:DNA-directed RNA polymerase subunit RPC12/RpoP